jgi:hypothetical protein
MNLASTPAPPAPAPPPRKPNPFLEQVHGAMNVRVPAKETELRGPQLQAAQQNRNVAMEGAIQAVTERSQETAAGDYALALEQERQAGIRADAATATAAQRAEEMAARQADFDQSAKALSRMSVDPGRYFANPSTGRVLEGLMHMIAAGFGGFVAARNGGKNAGLDGLYRVMDNDIKAQEFAYNASRDAVNAKQTAFSMAMQKYNNVDAARAATRAAMLDTVAAQAAQQSALWKGTESANRGSMAIASLQDERMQQIAAGVLFTPVRQAAVGAQYRDPRTGMVYTEKEAHGLVEKMDEREFKREEIGMKHASDLEVEGVKAEHKGALRDHNSKETQFIAEKLQVAGIPQARSSAEQALAALKKSPGGKVEAFDRSVTPDWLANSVHSDDANAREMAFNKFKNQAMKVLFGNVTASEEGRAEKQYGFSGDPASRERAIKAMMADIDAMDKSIQGGVSVEAQQKFARQRLDAEAGPALTPKGTTQGWGEK